VFLIVNDDVNDQSVMSFRVNLLTFKVKRLNFADNINDAAEYVRVKLVFNNELQVFLNKLSFHERKSLIAILASENENRSPFSEKVVEVHDVRCKLSLLLKS